jgi:hypothetical protein
MHTLKAFVVAEVTLTLLAALLVAAGLDWTQVLLAFIGLCSAYMAYRSHLADKKVEEVKATLATEAAKQEASRKDAAEAAKMVAVAAQRVERKTDAAAVKAEEVKDTLADATERTDAALSNLAKVAADTQMTGEAVHTLVNSAMSQQLKIAAVALRRLAEKTRGTEEGPEDEKAANLAEEGFRQHEAKQMIVDQGGKIEKKPERQY